MGLDTRRTENYLKGAGPSLEVVSGLRNLIRHGLSNPDVVGNQGDYTQRRIAEVLGNLPLLGNYIEAALKAGADEELTLAQREFKRRAAAEMSAFVHSRYGSALTGHELRLANYIAGGQFSVADTLWGLEVVAAIAERKVRQYEKGYPDVAGRIGAEELPDLPAFQPDPNAPLAPIDDRGTLEFLYSPFSGGR